MTSFKKHVLLDEGCEATQADEAASDAAKHLHSMVQSLCISAITSKAGNPAHAMLMLAQAANGILHLLARIAMPRTEERSAITSTATLFSALLAYNTAPCEQAPGQVMAEFSPLVLFDALKDTEKLSGQRPDELLNDTMCQVAREVAADPAMVARINRERGVVYRGNSTLN